MMKKGISLIVLVITIIVMIILAASVVITLSNTGVINRASEAVDATNEAQVQDMAALIWADAYMDNKRGTDLVNEVTTKLGEQGVTADKWNITVTDTGVTVTNKNSSSTTLGSLIKGPEDYGKTVDYAAKGVTKWQVFYEDETNGYVFLISEETVSSISLTDGNPNLTLAQIDLYNIFKLGQTGYVLNNNDNCNSVRKLITSYSEYANTLDYGTNVIGAIGGPTIELFAAGYNAKYNKTAITPIVDTTYTDDEGYELVDQGYFINTVGRHAIDGLTNDNIYLSSGYYYWLASPGIGDIDSGPALMIAGYSKVKCSYLENTEYVRPVVCLKSSIPATVGTGDYDFSLIK